MNTPTLTYDAIWDYCDAGSRQWCCLEFVTEYFYEDGYEPQSLQLEFRTHPTPGAVEVVVWRHLTPSDWCSIRFTTGDNDQEGQTYPPLGRFLADNFLTPDRPEVTLYVDVKEIL